MEREDTYPDIIALVERQYMDTHMDDWFVPEEDIAFLNEFEYDCWCDDRFYADR